MPIPVIDTILPTLEDSLIVGDPNAGKTRAAIHEMMCLLCGPLLTERPKVYGLFEMDAARVPNIVFISAETGQREIQILFNAAVAALGINRRQRATFNQHMLDHFQVFSKEDATFRWFYPEPDVLIDEINDLRFKPDIIYVDALTDVCPGCEKPDVEADFIAVLRDVTHTCGGFAWRFIHHTNAQKREAGGFPLKAWARHRLNLTRTAFDETKGISAYDITADSHWAGTKTYKSTMTVTGPSLMPKTMSYQTVPSLTTPKSAAGPTPGPFTRQEQRIATAIDKGISTVTGLEKALKLSAKYIRDTLNHVLIPAGQFQVVKTEAKVRHYGRVRAYRMAGER